MTKRTKRKPSTKRIYKKQTSKNNHFKWFALLAIAGIAIFIVLGLRMQEPSKPEQIAQITPDLDMALMEKMRNMLSEEKKRLDSKPLDDLLQAKSAPLPPEPQKSTKPPVEQKPKETAKQAQNLPSEVADYEKNFKEEPKVVKFDSKKPIKYSGKPKLAIVIDDVSFSHHVDKIKRVPFAITPSFLPPTSRHPNSAKLANSFEFYMVHLPMEAMSHNSPEAKTLKTTDSKQSIQNWINKLHKQFPKAIYYNNHTGSKFTSDAKAMDLLISILKSKNLLFVDSKTTPKSVAVEVGKRHGMSIHVRDVFLDNSYEKDAIRKQLKEAVAIAKARGKAIAIGHPHANTLSVLEHAGKILEDVEVVYLKDL